MRIDPIKAGAFDQTEGQVPHRTDAPEPKAQSRALVVLAPAAEARRDRPMAHRSGPFLAQLLATEAHLPQTRSRRRAEPEEALAAYRRAAKLVA